MRQTVDLSHFLPNDQGRKTLVYQELKETTGLSENELALEMNLNHLKPGSFTPEWPYVNFYFSIPCRILILREKCYIVECMFQKTENGVLELQNKVAARGCVQKIRSLKYSIQDFIRMSNSLLPLYEHELQSLRSKNFTLYQLSSSRRTMSKFSRKRYVFADGTSLPFFYHGLKSSIEQNSVP